MKYFFRVNLVWWLAVYAKNCIDVVYFKSVCLFTRCMQLRVEKNTLRVSDKTVKLQPGMAVTAEVQIGERRIIEFFLAPLLKAKSESIRER